MLTVAMPHCGLQANSTSGGEVVEREVLSRVAECGIDPHVLRPAYPGLRWWNSPAYFAAPLVKCLRQHRPQLLRAHSLRYTGLAAILAGWCSGLPVTAHFHHLEKDRLSWLDRWVLRRADQVTTDSRFSQHQARQFGVKAHVIRLGVDHTRFPARPMPAGQMVLLVGGTKPRKNVGFVKALWPDVMTRVPGALLLEVGQGVAVDDQAMAACYQRARVVAFPSILEGFGLPVLEAMASGRPVVCSDRGALSEFNAATTLALSSHLWVEWLVRYLTDDAQWDGDADANYFRSQEYSWERTARLTAEAWRGAVA